MKMKIKEIIIIEGRDDIRAIKRAVDADFIMTSGLGLNDEIKEKIRLAGEKSGIIIFTDPDYPGEKIRRTVKEIVPDAKEAFLSRIDAMNPKTKKFGIEFAAPDKIKEALVRARATQKESDDEFVFEDLNFYRLSGDKNSKALRRFLGDGLGIGYGNSKQFLRKLNSFGIKREELEREIKKWDGSNEN